MTVQDGSGDRFPSGMRVLAVDDDLTCLKLLENLLRRCDYHVTTTNQAVRALQLLRENTDKFDLVISDVHMPDMDGFKLLELVGLEMDLPVIMLSANSDTRAVMKGITHGACDYLLKPVRIEELKNIWQHVVRRRIDSKDRSSSDYCPKSAPQGAGDGAYSHATSGFHGSDGKLNKKRKDQNEDEDCDIDENGDANEDPSMQKKPRVVWSVELHRKFVAAVNQLGIDKAVPKRILELMNVEKLTRENVASHLQKYRLYLKRLSTVASQQASMAAAASALRGKDLTYMPVGSLDALGDLHALAGSNQLSNHVLASFRGSTHCSLNGLPNLSMNGLPSSGMIQFGGFDVSRNSTNEFGKFSRFVSSETQSNLLQGLPNYLDLEQLQRLRSSSSVADSACLPIHRQPKNAGISSFGETGIRSSGFGTSGFRESNDPALRGPHETLFNGVLENQAFSICSMAMESIDVSATNRLTDCVRTNDSWSNAVPMNGLSSGHLAMKDAPFLGDNFSSSMFEASLPTCPAGDICPINGSVGNVPAASIHNLSAEKERSNLSSFSTLRKNVSQSTGFEQNPILSNPIAFSSICAGSNSNQVAQFSGPTSDFFDEKFEMSLIDQSSNGCLSQMQNLGIRNMNESSVKLDEHFLDQPKMQGNYVSTCRNDPFEDLLSALIKQV